MLFALINDALITGLHQFARGGGGGSGGGGGGSGGGGGGIIILLGYLPMHATGAFLRRHGSSNVVASVLQQIIGWIIALAYCIFWVFIWHGVGFLVALGALAGMGGGLYNWFDKVKRSKVMAPLLKQAAAADPAWSEERLVNLAKASFLRYQEDWSQFRTEVMQTYMTPRYHQHATLLMYALQQLGRKDVMGNVNIHDVEIVDISDDPNNTKDSFTVAITASANDQLVDLTGNGAALFTDNGTFTEYWRFARSGDTWLLDGISQATEDPFSLSAQLIAFAGNNGFYYSADMGWLFLPKRGYLFGHGKFGTSDINNHIIGLHNGKLLVQLYTFVANPAAATKPLVIAQVNVPKQYGQIVVRRKKALQFGISGLERVETEWTKFNDKYEVFAESYEQATSFELLEPTYMEQLEALPFAVSIEVVDNVIYLYTDEASSTAETYETMMTLINKAFEEMRL